MAFFCKHCRLVQYSAFPTLLPLLPLLHLLLLLPLQCWSDDIEELAIDNIGWGEG